MRIFALLSLLFLSSCTLDNKPAIEEEKKEEKKEPVILYNDGAPLPDWALAANMYEVNIRQYTAEGTFNAFAEHLPRLKAMGVDVLWLMPIYPISSTKSKGSLGSYYAVSDYRAVNPEFGTLSDFNMLVEQIHKLDMRIILDWVPNHTGWDHKWIKEHPEWYTQKDGEISVPADNEGNLTDWTDVADLNYENAEMRKAMIEDMKYWIQETNIDGYRYDVAFFVPHDFWEQVMPALRAEKEALLMLAEAETPELRNDSLFNLTYGWSFHHLMNDIAKGKKDVNAIDEWLAEDGKKFRHGAHIQFTSNHDENSWNGTEMERMGDGHKAFAVLAATLNGMPLVYSGQEEPLRKRLRFFEKDTIGFQDYAYADFYKTLLELKHDKKALWNGTAGGDVVRLNASEKIYAFKREKGGDLVVVMLNLSDAPQELKLEESFGHLHDIFSGESRDVNAGHVFALDAWGYRVYMN